MKEKEGEKQANRNKIGRTRKKARKGENEHQQSVRWKRQTYENHVAHTEMEYFNENNGRAVIVLHDRASETEANRTLSREFSALVCMFNAMLNKIK